MSRTQLIFAVITLFMPGCSEKDWTEPFSERKYIEITDSIGVEWGDS